MAKIIPLPYENTINKIDPTLSFLQNTPVARIIDEKHHQPNNTYKKHKKRRK